MGARKDGTYVGKGERPQGIRRGRGRVGQETAGELQRIQCSMKSLQGKGVWILVLLALLLLHLLLLVEGWRRLER